MGVVKVLNKKLESYGAGYKPVVTLKKETPTSSKTTYEVCHCVDLLEKFGYSLVEKLTEIIGKIEKECSNIVIHEIEYHIHNINLINVRKKLEEKLGEKSGNVFIKNENLEKFVEGLKKNLSKKENEILDIFLNFMDKIAKHWKNLTYESKITISRIIVILCEAFNFLYSVIFVEKFEEIVNYIKIVITRGDFHKNF